MAADTSGPRNPQFSARGLPELVEILETAEGGGLTVSTLHGRALSRSDQALHLATPEGVVSIPFDTIEAVAPYPAVKPDPTLVYVTVRTRAAIRMLRPAEWVGYTPNPDPEPEDPPWPGPRPPYPPFGAEGTTTSRDCIASGGDTGTRTGQGGDYDATDDAPGDICTGLHVDD